MRRAIVTVHGVSEHYRYQHLETFGDGFLAGLNARGGQWTAKVLEPVLQQPDRQISNTRAAGLRFVGGGSTPQNATDQIDVWEAYWSPLAKHQVGIVSLLRWIYRYPRAALALRPRSDKKAISDLLLIFVGFFAFAILVTPATWLTVRFTTSCGLPPLETVVTVIYLAFAATIAVDLMSALLSVLMRCYQAFKFAPRTATSQSAAARALSELIGPSGASHIVGSIWLLAVCLKMAVLVAIYYVSSIGHPSGQRNPFDPSSILIVAVYAATLVIVERLYSRAVQIASDILTYAATNDNNTLSAVRHSVVDRVAQTIQDVLLYEDTDRSEPLYHEVIVFGHSLGASIAFEALRLLYRNGIQRVPDLSAFDRIRGFVTYGSAFEKVEEYLYGPTASPGYINTALRSYPRRMYKAIDSPLKSINAVWLNFWYRNDLVAGTMAGFEDICSSFELASPWYHAYRSHGEYFHDPNLWREVLDDLF